MPLRMPASLRLVTLAAAAALSMGAAQAHVVSAELSNLRFEVVDLDPGDGRVPSLDLNHRLSAHAWSMHTRVDDPLQVGTSTGDIDETSALPSAADEHGAPGVWHRSRAEMGATAGSLLAELDDTRPGMNLSVSAELASRNYGQSFIAIQAGSSLTISAESLLGVNTVADCSTGVFCAAAQGTTALSLALFRAPSLNEALQTVSDLHNLRVESTPADAPGSLLQQQSSDSLSVTFENRSGATVYALVDFQASAYGFAAAVPEPSTYALMLAGLGGVLLARRRRAAA
ncbi:PEP-CTERM sorting domain-containing protein [Eleftheria terrae]|uniref:PEP-CTERM sorting domain-containing protein n=1 Tax=Eleftheria terrae TaxID=1597781 RepID=UPI00263A7357|nr:PEP-CTERM sorting domain-containing protein [Eleftheria terrae]WKB52121.1 PEP-CTERM sorting domain-containing protein [Eleftheria terrae]